MPMPNGVLFLRRSDIRQLAGIDDYIDAVETAFRLLGQGAALRSGLLHIDAPGGEFHLKAGGLQLSRFFFGVKVNGGFFGNPARLGLPSIQGLIVLADAESGTPLAVMDSTEVTIMRTGAATAVAAKYLARRDASVITVCGCGTQGRIQILCAQRVLPIRRAYVWDVDPGVARAFALRMTVEAEIEVIPTTDLGDAIQRCDVCITCTPSRAPFVRPEYVPRGALIAAVGADSPAKQELDPAVLAAHKVVVDVLEQCAAAGELHHALTSGAMVTADVYAELADLATGRKPGRTSDDETIVFDATGTAIQDVAAAAMVYERAVAQGMGSEVNLRD